MRTPRAIPLSLILALVVLLPVPGRAQSFNGSISGTVKDPSGASVKGAELVLKNQAGGIELRRTSLDKGEYAFRNLVPGSYELRVTAAGFKPYLQKNVEVNLNADVRVDLSLGLGGTAEQVEVVAETSTLNYDSGAHEDGIAPDTLQQLPIQFGTGPRAAASFVLLMPGVSSGGGANPFDARINGGMQSGDEAVVDGASMQQGFMSQSGMISIQQDFPFSPDMVSEIKVVTSSYEPQYGSSTSGQIVATTKSGTDRYHGSAFDYHQRDGLNARQWGASDKGELKKNNFGGNVGGPAKIPGLWSDSVKTYFYVNFEGFRQTGGVNRPTISIPSAKERNGDFSDWRDSNGNLIPIYDPATTRIVNGVVVRDPFPGNQIPANRISPIARQFLQYLPTPTSDGPLNNYLVPIAIPDTILGDSNYYFGRFDMYAGQKDHFAVSLWHQRAPAKFYAQLPHEIATETLSDPQNSWVNRANWDHTFNPNLLNHFAFGYLNRNEGYGCVNADAVDKLPQIAGVASHNIAPQIGFSDGFSSFGCNAGIPVGNVTTRPTYVANDLLTWIRESHTLKFGFEYRNIGGNIHANGNEAGSFNFGRGATGILGTVSGSPIASFLLGAVDNSSVTFRSVSNAYPRRSSTPPARTLGPEGGPDGSRSRARATGPPATVRPIRRKPTRRPSLPVWASPTRSTTRRSSARVGGSSMTGPSTRAGAGGSARPASARTPRSAAASAGSSRLSSSQKAFREARSHRPRSSSPTTRTARGSTIATSTPTNGPAPSNGTSRWTGRSPRASWWAWPTSPTGARTCPPTTTP